MGAHHSQDQKDAENSGHGSERGSRRGSEAEKQPQTSMVPVEKLSKMLVERSNKEDGINGVTEKSFTKYLFPMYPELGRRFFQYVKVTSRTRDAHVPAHAFRVQCERVLAMLDDQAILETYVRMFGCEGEDSSVSPDGLRALLFTSYKLSMDHYPEGPQTCLMINKTLSSVVNGCFNNKDSHSVGFVVRWLQEHCQRLVFPIHRYCVHVLATRHRERALAPEWATAGQGGGGGDEGGLSLGTPVLERGVGAGARDRHVLHMSAAWLLAAVAPPLYSRPVVPPKQPAGLASGQWLARLVCALPSHWVPLYISRDHGHGANRFMHHTTAYRGPTLLLVEAEELVVVVCSPQEWHETHQYWGSADCALIQLFPTLAVIEKGPKMLYMNTSIRGYPKGLRAGSDPRSPAFDLREDFELLTFQGVPYNINNIEVWGCGDQTSRETQLEIKKWQVKEAERQRQVKLSTADWIEHPDRYLLELAGRPQYNNSAS